MTTPVDCRSCMGAAADLFRRLTADKATRFRATAIPHVYERGDVIFHEGTPALAVYCVRSGAIKLFRRLRHGDEVVIGVRGMGDLVGLRAVLAGLPHWVTATTLERAAVCTIPAQSFMDMVAENMSAALQLLRRLATESRLVESQLVERNHDRVSKRTARFLMQMAQGLAPGASGQPGQPGHDISMHREEMACLIGTTPETLSRTLHGLSERGILQMDRRRVRVKNLEALRKLAD
jgi:CRP-like cAMP-binding protein